MSSSKPHNNARERVVVIGAGIIGVCTANYLLKQGFAVDVIDPVLPGAEDQCSFGNAGGICPGSCIPNSMPGLMKSVPRWLLDPEGPLFVRLAYLPHALPWLLRFVAASRKARVEEISQAMRDLHRYTFECYEPLMREAGCEELLQKRGQLFVYETEDGARNSTYSTDLRRRHGVQVDILNAGEIQDIEPALAPVFKSALYLPEQGQCPNPGRLVARLAENAARQGARFVQASVKGFIIGPEGPRAVETDQGIYAADKIILAAGAWSAGLAAKIGDRIPFESERGYHVMLPNGNRDLKIQTISADRKFVASPMEDGLRLAGTVEFAGLDAPANMARADILMKLASTMFPDLDTRGVKRWMGHRPGTPDSIPVIDRASRHPNVIYAFGHGHQGLIAGAVTGKIVAEMAAGQTPSINIEPFRVNRFRR